jgi:hypothetical protein
MHMLMIAGLAVALGAQAAPGQMTIKPQIAERGLRDFELDGNGTWEVHGSVLALVKEGVPGGEIRRPAALAILKGHPLGDLTFNVDVRSTAPVDLAVRDVQVILGYRSSTEFYYVHISAKTDAVHNGIFIVNNADRKRIDEPTSKAYLTDQEWHRIRVERNSVTGRIAVFFDDQIGPFLTATDTTFRTGRVGVGSFDETGEFRNIEVKATPSR